MVTKRTMWLTGCLIALLSAPAAAQQQTLHLVAYPSDSAVKLNLAPTTEAPRATVEARVTLREGMAQIELEYSNLKPAILFGGEVTCYVLWGVTPGGFAKNVGEVPSGSPKGSAVYTTGLKSFALMVTAEPYAQVWRPSPLVMFINDPPEKGKVGSETFTFASFATSPPHDLDSIRAVAWDDDRPVELVQAERALAYADRIGAANYTPAMVQDARLLLAQATNLVSSSRTRSDGVDFARRSYGVSSNAIGEAERKIEAERLDREIASRNSEIAARTAEVAAMEARAAEAEQSLEQARVEREQLDAALGALRTEQAALTAAMASLREEKAELSSRLEGALGQVAETRSTARGMIVNLPDILFDVNQSTLKPEAKLVIAKLAGILLIMQDLNLRVEGHTDATGPHDYNLRLSEARALSVVQFLSEQGIAPPRMVSDGYGPDRPIASNDTSEGRKSNRRVEIVIAEGAVAEAPAAP
ncbi:MAG TPA: OmpA family protein [Thermoanaerobaculales bacterium]|nr:OmpA family protein [Thermoanaerobaculales bacterium]